MRDIAIDPLRRVRLKLQLLAILAVVFAGIISTVLIVIQQATILPQVISGKDVKVVETLNRKIAHAVSLGIPIEELNGIQEFLEENLRDNEEIRFLSVVTMNGLELAVAGHPPAPKAGPLYEAEISNNRKIYETSGYSVLDVPIFLKNGARIGTTYLSIDKSYIQRLIIKRIIDIITVLGVTTIVALQVLMLLLDRLMLGPLLSLAGWGAAVTGRQSPGAVMPFGF